MPDVTTLAMMRTVSATWAPWCNGPSGAGSLDRKYASCLISLPAPTLRAARYRWHRVKLAWHLVLWPRQSEGLHIKPAGVGSLLEIQHLDTQDGVRRVLL